MPAEITPQHQQKTAYVYVRQSTPYQVKHNLQSQQLQYELVDLAKAKGWPQEKIIVVDEDLGKSASGTTHREGLEKMLAHLCLGEVGVLFCAEASRLIMFFFLLNQPPNTLFTCKAAPFFMFLILDICFQY